MSTNFPTSVDDGTTLPNPSGANTLDSPDHASIHANGNDAIKAVEAKVGTGSSTPANNTFLIGNGTGTSAWSSLTSAQLASRISDETGTGSAVFATTPTLVTPKVDTINESTPANGVTVDGLNIKDGALNTNNSVVTANITDGAVTTAKIADGAVTADKLNLNPQTASVAAAQSTTSTSYTDLTTSGPAVTVTTGTSALVIVTSLHYSLNNGTDVYHAFAVSGATTRAATDAEATSSNGTAGVTASTVTLVTNLTAGSNTFTSKYRTSATTATFISRSITVIPL